MTPRNAMRRAGREGTALLLAVVMMGIVGALTGGLALALSSEQRASRAHERRVIATHLAEAGVDQAIAQLRAGQREINEMKTLGEGRFSTHAESVTEESATIVSRGELLSDNLVLDSIIIEACVEIHEGNARVVAWREKTP